jgi:hypothetical protein
MDANSQSDGRLNQEEDGQRNPENAEGLAAGNAGGLAAHDAEGPVPDGVEGPAPEHTDGSAPDNAKRHPGEIGGKRFRVGLDDAYVPFRNRTKRRRKAIAAALGGLLVLGVGAYGLVNLVTAPEQNAAADGCPAGSAHALAVQEQARAAAEANAASSLKFTLNVYNSTNKKGLAATTATQLKARGFVIGQVTNDPLKSNLAVSAQVRGGKASGDELREVAAQVPGAQIQTDGRNDPSIDLVLGSGFTTLASMPQVAAALQAATAVASASAGAVDCSR